MNLNELFEMQRQLDEHIEKEHPPQEGEDRLAKKILALQVELGELANEWRGFKYWSHNQEPRIRVYDKQKSRIDKTVWKNPLLEEYVDCLHFILSIGLELGADKWWERYFNFINANKVFSIERYFLDVHKKSLELMEEIIRMEYDPVEIRSLYATVFGRFVQLGEMLGFTWEQVEQAYLAKNKINHQRQESGY